MIDDEHRTSRLPDRIYNALMPLTLSPWKTRIAFSARVRTLALFGLCAWGVILLLVALALRVAILISQAIQ